MAKVYEFKESVDKMAITVFDVARALLTFESMPHKKLQKLCYYTYSWYLTLYNQRLFKGPFEAWIHGPVHPDLYQTYKDYGWHSIPKELIKPVVIDSDIYGFIGNVYDSYGELTGDQLEAITHDEEPWLEARAGLPEYEPSRNDLSDETIKRFYKRVLERGQTE